MIYLSLIRSTLLLVVLGLSIASCPLFAQYIGTIEIEESKVHPWIPKLQLVYAGVYHFGEGESESDLRLIFSGDEFIGQIVSGYWEEGTGMWKWRYQNLTNLKIDKSGRFSSDQYKGEFVIYQNGKEKHKGLKIENPWTTFIEDGKHEIGIWSFLDSKIYFPGKYPDTSARLLHKTELEVLAKEELQLMRNEIFARYGLILAPGGKMNLYFNKQDWYKPQHEQVTAWITSVELANIALIQQVEKRKSYDD